MKPSQGQRSSRHAPFRELAALRTRLAEAEDTLRAISNGQVDAVVVAGKQGDRVFTLEGAEHAYRVLIESMNEGALTLTTDAVILYANQCFAGMVKYPLETVTGSSFRRFLSAEDQAMLRPLLRQTSKTGVKIRAQLIAADGSMIPMQISIRPLAKNGFDRTMVGMVVTDMTEARRAEEMLRALTRRVVHAQEAERGRVAAELHDNITQLLCAVLFRSQVLEGKLTPRNRPLRREAMQIRKMLGKAANEVERISRYLRSSVLEQLGLTAALRNISMEFADRTGIPVKLACERLTARLPAENQLALYRIFQQALINVEEHACAAHVTVYLRRLGAFVQLLVNDDGVGFDPDHPPAGQKEKGALGLLGMRERATSVGGSLTINSIRRGGTRIEARVPIGLIPEI